MLRNNGNNNMKKMKNWEMLNSVIYLPGITRIDQNLLPLVKTQISVKV